MSGGACAHLGMILSVLYFKCSIYFTNIYLESASANVITCQNMYHLKEGPYNRNQTKPKLNKCIYLNRVSPQSFELTRQQRLFILSGRNKISKYKLSLEINIIFMFEEFKCINIKS